MPTLDVSACQSYHVGSQKSQINEVLFWTTAAVSILISIFGVIANTLVIYFAHKEPPVGALHHLNNVVQNLAVSNILYGALATPLTLAYWSKGKP